MSEVQQHLDPGPANGNEGRHGLLFVISSPSGGGKGTLIRRLLDTVPGVGYSVSWTTRPPRPGEVEGVNYHFASRDEFERKKRARGFLEWAVVHGNLYGTTRAAVQHELARGRDIVLEIDVQGAHAVRAWRKWRKSAVLIFILPPSFAVLRARLSSRMTERPEELELRLRNARAEVEQYRHFDYLVLNDEVERAAEELASVVRAERARRARRESAARGVLASFVAPAGVE